MADDLIAGKWTGRLNYKHFYPIEYRNKILSFTITLLTGNDHMISGTCEDDITRELLLKPATIEGSCIGENIHFIKRYPCQVTIDEKHNLIANPLEPSYAIQYNGTLHRRIFSRKLYFKGFWDITGSFIDEQGVVQHYTVGGEWTMERAK